MLVWWVSGLMTGMASTVMVAVQFEKVSAPAVQPTNPPKRP